MIIATVGQATRDMPSGGRIERRPRILHIAQPTDGGVRRYIVDVCADQLARGWQVTVACPDGRLRADMSLLNIPWRSWSATRSPGLSSVGEILAVRRITHSVAPDVVHLHSSKAGFTGRLALRGALPPIIFQPHGWSWLAVTANVKWLTIGWERIAARWTTAVVCVGYDEFTAGHNAGIRARMQIIYNGVDRVRFSPAGDSEKRAARRELDIPPTAPLVVCAGRVTRQKGQDILLAAWPAVRARCPTAQLALVGDGDLLAVLRQNACSSVRFVRSTADIRPWLAAADVVTVPSRWEGLPLIALEAVASGRSVVGTMVGGLNEIITPVIGCLVPPENPRALAHALARRLTDLALAAAEGRQAVTVAARFDQRQTLDQLAQLTLAVARHRDLSRPPSPTNRPPGTIDATRFATSPFRRR
jgi:glycosyltransferase involved in cell wall biosynthesis